MEGHRRLMHPATLVMPCWRKASIRPLGPVMNLLTMHLLGDVGYYVCENNIFATRCAAARTCPNRAILICQPAYQTVEPPLSDIRRLRGFRRNT